MLAANNQRQFSDLCEVLGHSEWVQDPRWAEPRARAANQDALRELFESVFLSKSAQEWEMLLDQVGYPRVVCAGSVKPLRKVSFKPVGF